MKLVPIQQVGGHIKAGAALPFGVRDAEGKLLLAKGQMVPSEQSTAARTTRSFFILDLTVVICAEASCRRGELPFERAVSKSFLTRR